MAALVYLSFYYTHIHIYQILPAILPLWKLVVGAYDCFGV